MCACRVCVYACRVSVHFVFVCVCVCVWLPFGSWVENILTLSKHTDNGKNGVSNEKELDRQKAGELPEMWLCMQF